MKHKRMGMARIEHQIISHPYLNSSSTMVADLQQDPQQDVFLDLSTSFSGAARPRPHPPKYNADALSTLAARSGENGSSSSSGRKRDSAARLTAKHLAKRVDRITASPMADDPFTSPPPPLRHPPASPSRLPGLSCLQPRPSTPAHLRAPFRRQLGSPASSIGSPRTPPAFRRRSSAALNSTPSASPQHYKANRGEASVDRALGTMLHSLRVAAHNATPSPKQLQEQRSSPLVSRWSSSSDEDEHTTSSTGWFSRKSNESARSKASGASAAGGGVTAGGLLSRRASRKPASIKSIKSATTSIRSIKSGKNGAARRSLSADMDVDDIPPLPAIPSGPPTAASATRNMSSASTANTSASATNSSTSTSSVPATPGRRRRMVEGFFKRLTPRKAKLDAGTAPSTKEAKDLTNRSADAGAATPSRGPLLVRSRTSPSLAHEARAKEIPPAVPPLPSSAVPPVPRMPLAALTLSRNANCSKSGSSSGGAGSSQPVCSAITRQLSSTTLRLGKSPRSSPNGKAAGASPGDRTSDKSATTGRASSSSRRPPVPAFDLDALACAQSLPPKPPGGRKTRSSASTHVPPPLPLGSTTRTSPPPSTPPRKTPLPTVDTPTRTPTGADSRSPTTPGRIHLPTLHLARSLSRGSRATDTITFSGSADSRPHRQSRSPISFSFSRQRSTLSGSESTTPSSAASTSVSFPLTPMAAAAGLPPSPSPATPTRRSPIPVLISRASYLDPQTPRSADSLLPSLIPAPPVSPVRSSSGMDRSPRSIRSARPVKSSISLPKLMSTTNETAFTAATGRVVEPLDDGLTIPPLPVVACSDAGASATAAVTGSLGCKRPTVTPLVIPETVVSAVEPSPEPAQGAILGAPAASFASFVSFADSCDDVAEVITFATPQCARRATATTLLPLKAVQALASLSSSAPASPAISPTDTPGRSPRTMTAQLTLAKLEAAATGAHARRGRGGSAAISASPLAETPALCRTSGAPSVSPSESDGVTTPRSVGASLEDAVRVVHNDAVPTAACDKAEAKAPTPEAATPADTVLTGFSADFTYIPHPTGMLTGKAARAAALAAANDPLKPRRLLQLLPRQQARLATHRRAGIFTPCLHDTPSVAEDVVMEYDSGSLALSARPPASASAESTPELDADGLSSFDPEIGLPIPPATPRYRRPSVPKLPTHLDRTRLRADSKASTWAAKANGGGRAWPAWPPKWDAHQLRGAHTYTQGDEPASAPPYPYPTAAGAMHKRRAAHSTSASVHTFGGGDGGRSGARTPSLASHPSVESLASVEVDEFGSLQLRQPQGSASAAPVRLPTPEAGPCGAAVEELQAPPELELELEPARPPGLDFPRRPAAFGTNGYDW